METNKVLSSLSYFSVFFAPFVVPIIIYFVVEDVEVKQHAKTALLSHLLPIGLIILSAVLMLISVTMGIVGIGMISLMVTMVVYGLVFIWNIIKGIQVLSR